jgi:hypothetical protein
VPPAFRTADLIRSALEWRKGYGGTASEVLSGVSG